MSSQTVFVVPEDMISYMKEHGIKVMSVNEIIETEMYQKRKALYGTKYLSISEAVKQGFFKVSAQTVHRWIKDEKLKEGIHYVILKSGKKVLLTSYLKTLI